MAYVKRTTKTGNTVEMENYFVSNRKNDAAARERRRKFWQALKACEQNAHR